MTNKRTDCHIHTIYSGDSITSPQRVVELALKRNLKRVFVTDHNTIKGALLAKEYAKGKDIEVVVGAEVQTNKGEITGLWLKEEVRSRDLMAVIAEIKAQGGKVLIPHPYGSIRRTRRDYRLKEVAPYADYIEVYNGRSFLNFHRKKILRLAKEFNLIPLCGSDAHFAFEIGNIETKFLYKGIAGFFTTGILNLFVFQRIKNKCR